MARAQGIARLFFSSPIVFLVLEGVAKVALDCAHRTRAFLGRASCEQGGHLAASPSPLSASECDAIAWNCTPSADAV